MHVLIILIIVGILFFILLNILYKRTNYYKINILQSNKFKEIPDNLDIINLGSSYAKYAFDYSKVEVNGFNFGVQPQSLSYDFRILKQYKNKLKKNGVVIITIPNFVFAFLDYSIEEYNYRYYSFLNKENILNYSSLKNFLLKYFPLILQPKKLRYILKDISKENSDSLVFMENNEEVKKEAQKRVNGWIRQFKLLNIDNKEELPLDVKNMFIKTQRLLEEMINYSLSNELKPVIVIPPCSKELNNFFSDDFLKEILYSNIEKANKSLIPVLDYLKDSEFQDYHLYMGVDLLNIEGRRLFTNKVITDLKKINYL